MLMKITATSITWAPFSRCIILCCAITFTLNFTSHHLARLSVEADLRKVGRCLICKVLSHHVENNDRPNPQPIKPHPMELLSVKTRPLGINHFHPWMRSLCGKVATFISRLTHPLPLPPTDTQVLDFLRHKAVFQFIYFFFRLLWI